MAATVQSRQGRLAGALLPLLLLAAAALPSAADVAQGEDTYLAHLASHDGMLLFNGALRKTIPPNATAATAADAVPCSCSDAAPRDTPVLASGPFLLTTDCFDIAQYQNCNASFMGTFLTELVYSDGFCQLSCGRCPCCVDPATLLQKMGATRFLQALQVASPSLLDLLSQPGWTGSLLVPTDAAFDAALAQYSSVLQNPALLQQVLKFHMLPPEPRTRGLWTTPFMATGAKLWTMADGNVPLQAGKAPIPAGTTAYGGLTGLTIQGPVNAAKVVGPSDLMACEAYLTVIDTVLLPFDTSAPALASPGAPPSLAAALGAPGQCVLQANAHFNRSVLVDGASNRQHTAGDCCASCSQGGASSGCNAFQWCPLKGGCRMPGGTAFPFGWCQLYRDAEVASGQPPAWIDFSGVTPLLSGYLGSASPPASGPPATGAGLPVSPAAPTVQAQGG